MKTEKNIFINLVFKPYVGDRSRNWGCLVTWFCYQLIAKPGNKTAPVPWPASYQITAKYFFLVPDWSIIIFDDRHEFSFCQRQRFMVVFYHCTRNPIYFRWKLVGYSFRKNDLHVFNQHEHTSCLPLIICKWHLDQRIAVNSFCPTDEYLWRIIDHHDDVIKWKHFPRYWPFVRGIHRSPVTSLRR